MTHVRGSRRGGAARLLAAAALLAGVLVGACGPASGPAEPVATTSVDLPKSYRFAPEAITVPTGSTVMWTNNDNFTHNVTLEGASPLPLAPGEAVSHTFDAPGTYAYVCTLHPKDMRGSVLVTG
jgi:plastocyanin